eukprot:scaffold110487_cov44-Phaeocystis_antarctica.AAC.2
MSAGPGLSASPSASPSSPGAPRTSSATPLPSTPGVAASPIPSEVGGSESGCAPSPPSSAGRTAAPPPPVGSSSADPCRAESPPPPAPTDWDDERRESKPAMDEARRLLSSLAWPKALPHSSPMPDGGGRLLPQWAWPSLGSTRARSLAEAIPGSCPKGFMADDRAPPPRGVALRPPPRGDGSRCERPVAALVAACCSECMRVLAERAAAAAVSLSMESRSASAPAWPESTASSATFRPPRSVACRLAPYRSSSSVSSRALAEAVAAQCSGE